MSQSAKTTDVLIGLNLPSLFKITSPLEPQICFFGAVCFLKTICLGCFLQWEITLRNCTGRAWFVWFYFITFTHRSKSFRLTSQFVTNSTCQDELQPILWP